MYYVLLILGAVTALKPTMMLRRTLHSTYHASIRPVSLGMSADEGEEALVSAGWKRPAVGVLALTGAVETTYLTYSKLMNSPVLCSTPKGSCETVLSSAFSKLPIVDAPLSAIAAVGYLAVAFFALFEKDDGANQFNSTALLALTTAMATFSGYLMWVLYFVLQQPCYYCYASAGISCLMASLARGQRALASDATKAFVVLWSSFGVTLASSIFLFYTSSLLAVTPYNAQASTAPAYQAMMMGEEAVKKNHSPPAVTSKSSPQALALAPRLARAHGKMYGAYWCSHCINQKKELGVEAGASFKYVECDKEGKNSEYPLCKSNKIPGFPTWELYGEYFPGEKVLPVASPSHPHAAV